MARPKEVMDRELALKARSELQKIKDFKVCIRLQAIISSEKYPEHLVASIFGINDSTLWRWIKRFKENGVEGLRDRRKGHNPSKLDIEQRERIKQWLIEGKNARGEHVHWTLAQLLHEIEREFGIRVGKTPLWLVIRKLGFRQKVPRPINAKADINIQNAFKKNF